MLSERNPMADLSITARLGLDGSQFEKALAQIGPKIAAAFSIAAIGAAIQKTAAYADQIEEVSQRLSISTKSLQEWGYAARQNGTDIEKLTTFIERLSDSAADLKNLPGFQRMGINPQGMTPEGLFGAVSSFTRGKGSPEITSALEEAGMSIKQIGPMLNLLQSDLGSAGKSAQEMGAVIDDVTIHQLASLNDQLSIVSQVLMSNFAPALLTAGKAALAAFSVIGQAGSWLGARTANISMADIKYALQSAFGQGKDDQGINALYNKFVGGGEMGLGEMADQAVLKESQKLDSFIASITGYKPNALSTISMRDKTPDSAVRRQAQIATDSLISVGNFLGASGRSTLESAAQRQVQLLGSINQHLAKIANTGGLDSVTP